jgi:predicted enzyme related to lactoylglutathione lyase
MRRSKTLPFLLPFFVSALASNPSVRSLPQEPVVAARFHHVHLNSQEPSRAIEFYTRTFDVTRRVSLAGFDGIQSEEMYLLFDRVQKPPALAPDTAIWHFGWGSTSMEADYQKLLSNGVAFHTPLTRLTPTLQFAYMKAPDGAIVEINTSNSHAFLHVHLYSDAPLCAADWYVKNLGATRRTQQSGPCEVPFAAPTEPLGVIRSPAATVRLGDISLIIYPRQRPGPLVKSRGHVVDHIAMSVAGLDGALGRLEKAGVKVLEKSHRFGNSTSRAAMIEGPDSIAIELLELK